MSITFDTTEEVAQMTETTDWRARAACRTEDPELFFPVGKCGPARAQIERAKAVCFACPVMAECRAYALAARVTDGVFGGLDEDERRDILLRSRVSA